MDSPDFNHLATVYLGCLVEVILLYIEVHGKLVILQLIGIMVIKSKETRVVTYTCRYSSELLILIHPDTIEL